MFASLRPAGIFVRNLRPIIIRVITYFGLWLCPRVTMMNMSVPTFGLIFLLFKVIISVYGIFTPFWLVFVIVFRFIYPCPAL